MHFWCLLVAKWSQLRLAPRMAPEIPFVATAPFLAIAPRHFGKVSRKTLTLARRDSRQTPYCHELPQWRRLPASIRITAHSVVAVLSDSTVEIMPMSKTRLELERELCQIVAEKLELDPNRIRMHDDVVADLGADSLALAELTLQLEQRLGVKVPGEEWLEVITIGELADLIERYQHT